MRHFFGGLIICAVVGQIAFLQPVMAQRSRGIEPPPRPPEPRGGIGPLPDFGRDDGPTLDQLDDQSVVPSPRPPPPIEVHPRHYHAPPCKDEKICDQYGNCRPSC